MSLLAQRGDVVVLRQRVPEFEDYLMEWVGLDDVTFVQADTRNPAPLAVQCRTDPALRERVAEFLRRAGSLTVQPYLTTGHDWRFAQAIGSQEAAPVHVAGPRPRIARRSNNKLWFCELVRRVVGVRGVPPTHHVYGLAAAAARVSYIFRQHEDAVVKVPASAGSAGNIRLPVAVLAGVTLSDVREILARRLAALGWKGEYPILVGVWDRGVAASPSAQLYVPKADVGAPVVEAIFEQRVSGPLGEFVGASPAELDSTIEDRMRKEATAIGTVLQRLGYYGPCALDAVLYQSDRGIDLHWIECNGRWSGVSMPLSVSKRLALPARRRGLAIMQDRLEIAPPRLADMIAKLGDLLFRRERGEEGLFILSPPQSPRGFSLNAMAIALSQERAEFLLAEARRRLSS